MLQILCQCSINTKEGKFGYSYSLQDAKNRKVFRKMIAEDIEINDSLFVKYVWFESKWTYQHDSNFSDTTEGSQVILEFKNDRMLDNYMRTWKITNKETPLKGLGKVGERSCYLQNTDSLNTIFYAVSGMKLIKDTIALNQRKLFEFSMD